jgi:ABC-type transport system involved in cytochrome c biogenesis permease subunit
MGSGFLRKTGLTLLRAIGSLRLAVLLIALCVVVLAWATLLEKQNGADAARFAVYGTGWFAALFGLLGLNVACATFVRIPWGQRQSGFLVTHAGILILLAGCWATRQYGIEAQLPVLEGQSAHRALQDSLHFELRIASPNEADIVCVPFVPGPFAWKEDKDRSWFPWRLAYRSQGTLYHEDGITLEVLDYTKHHAPTARVKLTVDGSQKEFDVPALSEAPPDGGKRCIVDGDHRNVAVSLRQDTLDLGFQIHLQRFQRKLDPGADTASHYSSVVDILDRNDPPAVLKKDALIALNDPLDIADPVSGKTYRLFQASFDGPWLPGEPEFDRLAGDSRQHDRLYVSRFTVNYDPGRDLKYVGSLMIVVGILLTYFCFHRKHKPSSASSPNGCSNAAAAFLTTLAFGLVGSIAQAGETTDWAAWQHLPVFGDGRIVPMDTFASETVATICGRTAPTLTLPNSEPRTFAAPELLFCWLAEPKTWENVPFLIADDPELRQDILKLPLSDASGRQLLYATPHEVEDCDALGRRWADIEQRADAEGKAFRCTGLDKRIKALIEAYTQYRLLTHDPKTTTGSPQRFYSHLQLAAKAWRKLAVALQGGRRVDQDNIIRMNMVKAGESLQKLIASAHEGQFSSEKIEPLVVTFHQAAESIAQRIANSKDKPLAALANALSDQTIELQMAIYDDGETVRLVPALNPGALEEGRLPGDDAVPWLSFQAVLYGSADLLRPYPQTELKAVREAWTNAKKAYLDRKDSDRPAKLTEALQQFADAVRAFGERTDPLRERLPLQHADAAAMALTTYPPPGATDLEVLYNRCNLFLWAWVLSLAASVCLVTAVGRLQRPMFWIGVAILVAAQTCTTAGLALRGCIMGLIPLTGMFETVVSVALYAGLLGIGFALLPLLRGQGMPGVLERRLFVVAGAIVSFIAMVLAYYAPATVMHRPIGSVTPILRDNFWLAVHVVTIMTSYASAAIALILGNIALGYYLFGHYDGRRQQEMCRRLNAFIYIAIQITVLLLTAGTILGAFWADKAWGRFWAWDPKEVWALISLLVYAAILHARFIGWVGNFGMTLAAVLGATAILFTWYGVNFLLGSGMHSYGSGAGGQVAVGSAVAAEWLFLTVAGLRYWFATQGTTDC